MKGVSLPKGESRDRYDMHVMIRHLVGTLIMGSWHTVSASP
jgi:hypothetical protein